MVKNIKIYLLIIAVLYFTQSVNSLQKNPFKHMIVLMMENHSFDNMLGFLEAPFGSLNEEVGCNWHDGEQFCQTKGCDYQTQPDPPHQFLPVQYQLYNKTDYPTNSGKKPNMGGFVSQFVERGGKPQDIMQCFSEEQVPVISKLAKEFTLFDRWFASVPSQTNPNKLFMHAASSGGQTGNCNYWFCATWPVNLPTIYDSLQEDGHTYSIHFHDWCEAMSISPLRYNYDNFEYDQNFEKLFEKLDNGTLEDYVYLVPRIHWDQIPEDDTENFEIYAPNTQHPSEDVRSGDLLMKNIYEKLRASEYWEDTLLLIVYDEHGGYYDHVVPPQNVTNPSPQIDPSQPFDFTRLGIRVPAIAISPWLKQTVVSTQLEHASIPHTAKNIFDLSAEYLNKRDEQANPFITDDIILDEMRQDCTTILPSPPSFKDDPIRVSLTELNGSPKSEAYVMGTILVKEGLLSEEIYETLIKTIHSDEQAIQFVKEAQIILGYRPQAQLQFKILSEMLGIQRRKSDVKEIFE